jgi:hypothetical protein
MAIELSNVTFTEQDDIVPASGVEEILNTGMANTLAGNDRITGSGGSTYAGAGIRNELGIIDTGDGNDTIAGLYNEKEDFLFGFAIYNIQATIDTGDGDDIITGTSISDGFGINNNTSSINTGNGDDIITGTTQDRGVGIYSMSGTIDTGKGNDTITGTGLVGMSLYYFTTVTTGDGNDIVTGTSTGDIVNFDTGLATSAFIDTGNGDDIITGTSTGSYGIVNGGNIATGDGNDIVTGTTIGDISRSGLYNGFGTINTGNGEDSIISHGGFYNYFGVVFLEDGDDSIFADADFSDRAIENLGFIGTGDGNDTITSTGVIYNEGIIETGNGDDSIIVDIIDDLTGTSYGIYNNGGAINMGDGNDSIIANEGFESGENSSGAWFLGEGEDYIKGFGSGDFYGGNGNDTLELTPGTYTVGIWGEGGESPIFTRGNQLMITSEFETLIAGGTTYDFTSLTEGQIIIVS